MSSFPRKVLVIAEGQLGDLLLLTPALRSLKQSYPDAHLSVLVVDRQNAPLSKPDPFASLLLSVAELTSSPLSTNAHVNELLMVYRRSLRSLRGIARINAELKIVRSLRAKKFDTVICTFPEDRFVLWAYASGAGTRVGQSKQGLSRLLTTKVKSQKAERGVLEYYCDLVEAVGATIESRRTEYAVSASARSWAERVVHPRFGDKHYVVIHPGASGDYKIWPPERYAALIDRLAAKGRNVLLLCGPIDKPIVKAIAQRVQTKVAEVQTGNNVGEVAALIERASLCISNDSGPRHLAIAVGTPSLAFFRHHHDKEWGVYQESDRCVALKGKGQCAFCAEGVCLDRTPEGKQFGSYCLRLIEVDEAMDQIEAMIKARGSVTV